MLLNIMWAFLGILLGFILSWLIYKFFWKPPEPGSIGCQINNIAFNIPTMGGETKMALVKLTPTQQVAIGVTIKDASGNNARVEKPQWAVTGPLRVVSSVPPITPPSSPGVPTHPIILPGEPTHPIVLPPEGAPPRPSHPIVEVPAHPIVLPPDQPATPPGSNLPPRPSHPDVGIPRPEPHGKALGSFDMREDGAVYSCTVAATGESGAGTVTFYGDADLGEGVATLVGTCEIFVAPGQATVIELVPGDPTEQASPGPAPQGRSSKK